MRKLESEKEPKPARKSSPWMTATIIVWLAVVGVMGVVAVYVWIAVDSQQIEQVRQLRHEMDSLSNRGYQLQHKIDSLDRLGVADIDLEDTTSITPSHTSASPQ